MKKTDLKFIEYYSAEPNELNPNEYTPNSLDEICLLLTLCVGVEGEDGGNYFNLNICTPEWLSKHQWEPEILRHTLIIREFDPVQIEAVIKSYIEKCTGDTWDEVALKLSRYFFWEFEDYVPFEE